MSSNMSFLSDNSQSNWQSRGNQSGGPASNVQSGKSTYELRPLPAAVKPSIPQMANQVAPGTYYGPVDRAHSNQQQASVSRPMGQSSSGQPTMRQHQQNVEQVTVPDASKFFALDVTTRQSILSKLYLNSLVEYIEHLEKYRIANRDKIIRFHQMYYPVVKCDKMRDPDMNLIDQDLTDPMIRLTGEVANLVKSIEAKLEACQLNRVMNSGLEMLCPLPQLKATAGQKVHGKKAKDLQEEKIDKRYLEVELIDLTTCDEQLQNGNASNAFGPNGEDDQSQDLTGQQQLSKLESKPDVQVKEDSISHHLYCISPVSILMASPTYIRKQLIDEVEDKLRQLELVAKQASLASSVIGQATSMATTSKPIQPVQPVQTQASCSEAKLMFGGFELPLPRQFNQLPQTEKNVLMCQLPEVVRGQYLNLCWESRFIEQLTNAPIDVRKQMLTSLNL